MLVIFDIGNTLVTGPPRGPARRISAGLGLGEEQRRVLHDALMTTPFAHADAVAAFVRERFGVARAEPAVRDVWRAQERDATPVPGAAALLCALHERGATLALLSNIWPPYLASVRAHLGATFDALIPRELQVFSSEARDAKPSRALFDRVLRTAGAAPADAVMIGDSLRTDIEPAHALGLRTVWITDAEQHPAATVTTMSVTALGADAVLALAGAPA